MGIHFEVTTVAGSDVDPDGFPRVQARGLGRAPTVAPSDQHSVHGLLSRPLDPDVDQDGGPTVGCLVLHGTEGDQGHAWLGGDPRLVALLPPRGKGSSIFYGAVSETDATKRPAIAMFDSAQGGSFSLLVPHSAGSTSSGFFVSVATPGAESVAVRHGLGMGLSIFAGGKNPCALTNKNGDGGLVVDDDGCTLNGTKIAINGSCLIGDPVAAVPLALGPQVVALLTQLIAVVAAMPGGSAASAITGQLATLLSTKAYAT